MTGQAEANRQILPDPTKPTIHNGDFEEMLGDPPYATSWYYQRQMELVNDGTAPSGKFYARFKNFQPGRPAQAIQGFAVDGRKVKAIEVSMKIRGQELRPGLNANLFPRVLLNFYDENRSPVGEAMIGPFRGTFAWQPELHRIPIPQRAREAILWIGLIGGMGEIGYDAVQIKAVK